MLGIRFRPISVLLFIGSLTLLTSCEGQKAALSSSTTHSPESSITTAKSKTPTGIGASRSKGNAGQGSGGVHTITDPVSIDVLVNKQNRLPPEYKPPDLVVPNVPFLYSGHSENHMMRKAAAQALEKLFAAANQDGIYLDGVSAYRSFDTQKALFAHNVQTQGEEMARKYSALPGESEHETGLAIDVSGSSGTCAVEDCFADTPEAAWLTKHAYQYGFIVRYPKGMESITGYAYEPWHIRYVGTKLAAIITAKGITLDQYFQK